jgi:uncharacterized protein (DUF1330 family)
MNRYITVGLAMVAGAALGAAAVQTLYAQAKPPAFNIAEITITNEEGYDKEFIPLMMKTILDAGGKFLVRGDKTLAYEGGSAPPRIALMQFENLDKVKALYGSAAFKQAMAVGNKYSTQRVYAVQGVSP